MRRLFACLLAVSMVFTLSADVFDGKRFFVGCNYWASHAGVRMWRDWNEQQVEQDLDCIAGSGMTVLRVFPLWPDFQPLTAEFKANGAFREYSQNGGRLKNYAAVDDTMIERFRFLCRAAQKRGLKLVVGLITGWMSGKMFVPPALERLDALSDPDSVMWQVRYVRYLVNALKDEPAIVAWDLGNECNCMAFANASQMWNWIHQIASEIRLGDPTRLVVGGMHTVKTVPSARTNVRQQGELVDVLTTHPYPLWTPNCNREPFDTIRNGCHAACESVLYRDLSGRACFAEEAGSMGPAIVSEERAAASMRTALFSCWASGLPGYCWWCAFDQDRLAFPPYEWTAIERELGLFTAELKPKPTARMIGEFSNFIASFPFELPPRQVDACVLISETEDFWREAQGAWLLAKEAGFDISYSLSENPLPDTGFYILPSGCGYETYSRSAFWRVMEKVNAGATALITLGDGAVLSNLKDVAGIEVGAHYQTACKSSVFVRGRKFAVEGSHVWEISSAKAKVHAANARGMPMLTVNEYGKGKVVFFNAAIERNAPLVAWPVYAFAAEVAGVARMVGKENPNLGLTEHLTARGSTLVIAINYDNKPTKSKVDIQGRVRKIWRGSLTGNMLDVGANDAAVFEVEGGSK